MSKLTSGKALSEKEFQVELEKLNKMSKNKTRIILLGRETNSEEVLNILEDYDSVDAILDDTILRISKNGKYWIGGTLHGFTPTSKEKGFTVDERSGAKISVNYTSEQQMKRVIDFFLGNIE